MATRPNDTESALALGWQALGTYAWGQALEYFQDAVARDETPEGLEGLGWAAYWLNDTELSFHAWEKAYRSFAERRDRPGAARIAVWLAANHFLRRGEYAVANGWVRSAHRWLEDLEPSQEHAMVTVWEAYMAITADHDTVRARALSEEARIRARALGSLDIEMLAQAIDGYSLVNEGEIDQGMRLLDEATAAAVSGEMTDLETMTVTCCFLIYACARVGDFERAAQWCDAVLSISERWSYRAMFAMCRSHIGELRMWRGDWGQAEIDLTEAYRELTATFPAMAYESVLRLGELRRRQGRIGEAISYFDLTEQEPLRSLSIRGTLIGRSLVAHVQGEHSAAIELAERFLRSLEAANLLEQVTALDVIVRAHVALGTLAGASDALLRLEAVTRKSSTPLLKAVAMSANGVLAGANGDLDMARQRLEDAIDLYKKCGMPYEGACCRLHLAEILDQSNRKRDALREASAARAGLSDLGAMRDADRAAELVERLEEALSDTSVRSRPLLTNREVQILRLIADGLGNKEIAKQLEVSEHTIHRHVANMLTKMRVPSRAAAVAYAAQMNLL